MLVAIGASVLLYMSGFFILWTPWPLLYRFSRAGGTAFIVAVVAAFAGLFVIYNALLVAHSGDPSLWARMVVPPGFGFKDYFGDQLVVGFGLLYFAYYGAIAGLLGLADRDQWSIERSVGLAVMGPLLLAVLTGGILVIFLQVDIAVEVRGYLSHLMQKIVELGGTAGVPSQDLRFIASRRDEIAEQVLHMLPAGIVIGTLVTVWCNILLARIWRVGKSAEQARPLFGHFGDLSQWRLPERFIWILIVAGLAYFIDFYGSGTETDAGSLIGIFATNVLWIGGAIYFFQGLAIVSFFVQRRASFWVKIAAYGLFLLFFQVMAVLVAVLGVFDIWFNFRRAAEKKLT